MALRVSLPLLAAAASVASLPALAAPAGAPGGFLPPGSASACNISNMVLVYADARSFAAGSEFNLTATDWVSLILQCEARLFDAVLFTGYMWSDNACFWPGQCRRPLNASDWRQVLALWTGPLGARGLDAATLGAFGPGAKTKVFVTIPYPDERAQDFGSLDGSGRSLNFSEPGDRVEASCWWVRAVREALAPLENVEYVGSYWYLEGTNAKDHLVLSQVSACVHAAGLKFAWIPDYADGVEQGQAVQWRELGFDFATLQPNYAFYDVTTQRFANTSAAMSALGLGVEMELPMVVRNELIGANSTTSFYAYLDAAVQLGWAVPSGAPGGALKTWCVVEPCCAPLVPWAPQLTTFLSLSLSLSLTLRIPTGTMATTSRSIRGLLLQATRQWRAALTTSARSSMATTSRAAAARHSGAQRARATRR